MSVTEYVWRPAAMRQIESDSEAPDGFVNEVGPPKSPDNSTYVLHLSPHVPLQVTKYFPTSVTTQEPGLGLSH